ncbi:hypothetical protein QQX98_003813 [Neonectria punicea]|uniref:Enoyl reductase (ER) domain-containing protein n=1 Tax=Neonectria punicea TaxID=979145 RepID=A0ABR1HCQ3_9HYPO
MSWFLNTQNEDLSGLVLGDPKSSEVGNNEVLVNLRAASLNYRELAIAKGMYGLVAPSGVVPGSDGAGVVLKVGGKVTSLKPGDKVVTHMLPRDFPKGSLSPIDDTTLPTMAHVCGGLGHEMDGTLTSHGVFPETCLVKFEGALSFEQAATLTCSGLTAWNALTGLEGKKVKKGDWVLVQASGGVSVASLQFAIASGATVVATTSTAEKAAKLKGLGASHIANYRETPAWGAAAKQLTPDGRGFDIVVDVAGDATLSESLQAVRLDGLVVVAGMVGGGTQPTPLKGVLGAICVVRGIVLGTRAMMREMVEFVEDKGIEPALDEVVFGLGEVKEAYRRLEEQKHFSKIMIQIPSDA